MSKSERVSVLVCVYHEQIKWRMCMCVCVCVCVCMGENEGVTCVEFVISQRNSRISERIIRERGEKESIFEM